MARFAIAVLRLADDRFGDGPDVDRDTLDNLIMWLEGPEIAEAHAYVSVADLLADLREGFLTLPHTAGTDAPVTPYPHPCFTTLED